MLCVASRLLGFREGGRRMVDLESVCDANEAVRHGLIVALLLGSCRIDWYP